MRARRVLTALSLVFWSLSATAGADPLKAGDTLRVTFDMSAYDAPPPLSALDVLQFNTGLSLVEPIGSFTVRVFDRGVLLGAYTAPFNPNQGVRSYFRAASSRFRLANPVVMDFTSINDGSFDGAVELTIDKGLGNWSRISEGLVLGQALDASTFLNSAFVYPDQHASWNIVPASPSPVPEPASVVLLGIIGAVGLLLRRRSGNTTSHPPSD